MEPRRASRLARAFQRRFTGPRVDGCDGDSTTTNYFLPSPLCRDWCFLCLPRKPKGRPSFLLPFARLWIIFFDPFCQLRSLFQCARTAAASVFLEHWAQARSTMLLAVGVAARMSDVEQLRELYVSAASLRRRGRATPTTLFTELARDDDDAATMAPEAMRELERSMADFSQQN